MPSDAVRTRAIRRAASPRLVVTRSMRRCSVREAAIMIIQMKRSRVSSSLQGVGKFKR